MRVRIRVVVRVRAMFRVRARFRGFPFLLLSLVLLTVSALEAWLTDAGAVTQVSLGHFSFLVGSTVFHCVSALSSLCLWCSSRLHCRMARKRWLYACVNSPNYVVLPVRDVHTPWVRSIWHF